MKEGERLDDDDDDMIKWPTGSQHGDEEVKRLKS